MQLSSTLKRVSVQGAIAIALTGLGLGLGGLDVLAQTKPTISVPSFKNETTWWWWRGGTSRELADALSNELSATGNFQVVERQELGEVLSEQELAELGIVRKGTGAQSGQVTGAQYVILGKVTSYEEDVNKKSTGLGVSGIKLGGLRLGGGGRKKKRQAYVAIDLRVVHHRRDCSFSHRRRVSHLQSQRRERRRQSLRRQYWRRPLRREKGTRRQSIAGRLSGGHRLSVLRHVRTRWLRQ